MPKNVLLIFIFVVLAGFTVTPVIAQTPPDAVPATSWFPVLPFEAAADTAPQLLPVASNHPLDGDHTGITRAVIVIHDSSRDAQGALAVLSALAGSNNTSTIILAPQFLIESDVAHFAAHLPEQGRIFVRWKLGGWEDGGDSIAQLPQKSLSSFTALDLLLLYLGEKKFFPDLQQIAVAGHGTGGDFVQRYAAAGRAPDILSQQNLPVRFLVANASSYLYFTAARPKGGKQGFASPDATACPDFNAYRYGLDHLNDYARRVGVSAIKLSYAARPITYLIGEQAAAGNPFADTGCAAMLEGADRVARAMNYNMYLYQLFGEPLSEKQKFFTIPRAGYDAPALFGSSCGMSVLFGDGGCEAPAFKNAENPR